MSELVFVESEASFDPPSYGAPGSILFRYDPNSADYLDDRFKVLDSSGCTFWMSEGCGIEFWLDHLFGAMCPVVSPGQTYVLEDVVGSCTRGEWGFTDGTENFKAGLLRVATDAEIASEALSSS